MKTPTIAFLPSDIMWWNSWRFLVGVLQDFGWSRPTAKNLQESIKRRGDGDNWMKEMVWKSELVIVGICDVNSVPLSWECGWRAAIDRGLPILVVEMDNEVATIPAELTGFPRCDFRAVSRLTELKRQQKSVTPADEAASVAALASLHDAVVTTWDSAIPREIRTAIDELLQKAGPDDANSGPENAIQRLAWAIQAETLADEHQAARLKAQAERLRRQCMTQLDRSLTSLTDVTSRFLEHLLKRCDQIDSPEVALQIQLTCLEKFHTCASADEAIVRVNEVWYRFDQSDLTQRLPQLRARFESVLDALFQRVVSELETQDPSESISTLERIAALTGRMQDAPRRVLALTILALTCLNSPAGFLRAIKSIEAALQFDAEEFPAVLREQVLMVGDKVAETIDARIEVSVKREQFDEALEMLRLLIRLRRNLPDQKLLANALACLALISEQRPKKITASTWAAQEARSLANVYGLSEVSDLLAGIVPA